MRHATSRRVNCQPMVCQRRGYTLVELLVTVAIIGILAALLLPAIQSARESARRTVCTNHIHQVALAILNYESAQGELPSMWRTGRIDPWENFSWRTTILPYLEQQAVYDRFDLTALPLDEVNQGTAQILIEEYLCPSTPDWPRTVDQLGRRDKVQDNLDLAAHDLVAIHDVISPEQGYPYRGVWHAGRKYRIGQPGTPGDVPLDQASAELRAQPALLKKVLDGLSKTALIVEQAGKPNGMGRDASAARHSPSEGAWATCDVGSFYGRAVNTSNFVDPFGFHDGAIVALCDGSVSLLHESTPEQAVNALFSRDGNEIMGLDDWQPAAPAP